MSQVSQEASELNQFSELRFAGGRDQIADWMAAERDRGTGREVVGGLVEPIDAKNCTEDSKGLVDIRFRDSEPSGEPERTEASEVPRCFLGSPEVAVFQLDDPFTREVWIIKLTWIIHNLCTKEQLLRTLLKSAQTTPIEPLSSRHLNITSPRYCHIPAA